MALEPAMGCPRLSKDESAYRHADCCKDALDRYPLFAEESSNSLSQRLVFMEEPPDGLKNYVDLRPERASSLACLSSSKESLPLSFSIQSRISC